MFLCFRYNNEIKALKCVYYVIHYYDLTQNTPIVIYM